eukprot:7183399-Pyramimonas_sp.AAC.1
MSNAKLRRRSWGNRGADPGGTARGSLGGESRNSPSGRVQRKNTLPDFSSVASSVPSPHLRTP